MAGSESPAVRYHLSQRISIMSISNQLPKYSITAVNQVGPIHDSWIAKEPNLYANAFMAAKVRVIALNPVFIRCFGSMAKAVYIAQLDYWMGKGVRKDGFIWKTKEEIKEETTLAIKTQDKCRKYFEEVGILETKVLKAAPSGSPTLHYRINQVNFMNYVGHWYEQNGVSGS
jgi:hypothetical protein